MRKGRLSKKAIDFFRHVFVLLCAGMGQLGDADSARRFGDKSIIRHDIFDGRAFYVLFLIVLSLALGLSFRAPFQGSLNKHAL